jgi:hypothetical protein
MALPGGAEVKAEHRASSSKGAPAGKGKKGAGKGKQQAGGKTGQGAADVVLPKKKAKIARCSRTTGSQEGGGQSSEAEEAGTAQINYGHS